MAEIPTTSTTLLRNLAQNALQYVLEGDDTDLLFKELYYPTNLVRGAFQAEPNIPSDKRDTRMLFRR